MIIKVRPNIHIFFFSFIPNNIDIKKIRIHIAHGLKPSTNPIITPSIGSDTSLAFMFPRIGTSYSSSLELVLSLPASSVTPRYTPTLSEHPSFKHSFILFSILLLMLLL